MAGAAEPRYILGLLKAMTSKRENRAHSPGASALPPRCLLAALLCLLAAFAAAADAAPRVLQIVQPQAGERDLELQEILTRFLRIELERAGLLPIPSDQDKPIAGARRLAALAAEQKARFVLIATYLRSGQDVELELQWLDPDSSRVAATEQRTAPINLELDGVVASAARVLLDRTGARRERVEVVEKPQTVERPVPLPPAISAAGVAPPEPFRPFESTIAFSAVLTTGFASDYFKYGFMPSAFAGYRVRVPRAALALGLSAGYNSFVTEDAVEETGIETVPIGAEARYEYGGSGPLLVYLRAAAGPALLRFQPVGGDWLVKLVPFGIAGIGVGIPLTDLFGITVEASYSVYLEKAQPIMGFTPSIGTYVRWGG